MVPIENTFFFMFTIKKDIKLFFLLSIFSGNYLIYLLYTLYIVYRITLKNKRKLFQSQLIQLAQTLYNRVDAKLEAYYFCTIVVNTFY